MKKILSAQLAGTIILALFSLLILMHFLILFNILPPDFVWGGQIESDRSNLVIMESSAILLLLLFGAVIIFKMKNLNRDKPGKAVTIFTWLICAYFTLNTVGNLLSQSSVETLIFTPLTILLALLALRLAVEK